MFRRQLGAALAAFTLQRAPALRGLRLQQHSADLCPPLGCEHDAHPEPSAESNGVSGKPEQSEAAEDEPDAGCCRCSSNNDTGSRSYGDPPQVSSGGIDSDGNSLEYQQKVQQQHAKLYETLTNYRELNSRFLNRDSNIVETGPQNYPFQSTPRNYSCMSYHHLNLLGQGFLDFFCCFPRCLGVLGSSRMGTHNGDEQASCVSVVTPACSDCVGYYVTLFSVERLLYDFCAREGCFERFDPCEHNAVVLHTWVLEHVRTGVLRTFLWFALQVCGVYDCLSPSVGGLLLLPFKVFPPLCAFARACATGGGAVAHSGSTGWYSSPVCCNCADGPHYMELVDREIVENDYDYC